MKKTSVLKILFLSFFMIVSIGFSNAQQWGDYTFYSVMNSSTAYLVDTNGTTFHTWTFASNAKTGYSSYMLPGGTVLRTVAKTGNLLSGGGMTGRVQKVDYNNNVLWDFTYSSATYCLHHDVCALPNGNVLMISYDVKTAADAIQAGCSSSIVIWSEKIIEVQPTGATTGTIVWEWKLWDHLCQNYNSAKDNYVSSIVQNPQLMNINYGIQKDYFHMNGIDYNVALDQIVVSSHYKNEFYVIDHSTTTVQAASHTGGNAGKGGDFLYRWGNPAAYGATGSTIFNVMHDAHWIPQDCPKAGYFAAFNNKGGSGNKSCIDMANPPLNGFNYNITLGSAYLPATSEWRHTYTGNATQDLGNSQHLPNGNVLLCIAMSGYIYEIDSNQNILWSKSVSGTVPHAYRYTAEYLNATPSVTAYATQTNVCLGDSTRLIANSSGINLTYSWTSVPAGFTSTLQNPYVTPSVNTTYTVNISNGTLSANSSVNITINPLPVQPLITQNGNSLNSSLANGYQWFLNNTIIPGATYQNYTPLQSGDYQVKITDANGCKSALSASLNFIYTGIYQEKNYNKISISPNPANSILNILNIDKDCEFEIFIFDSYGKLVLNLNNEKSINVSEFKNGIYFIKIYSNNSMLLTNKICILK